MKDETPKSSPLDKGLTDCIQQLADRAHELGEEATSSVLYILVAHRLIGADTMMAVVSHELGNILRKTLR